MTLLSPLYSSAHSFQSSKLIKSPYMWCHWGGSDGAPNIKAWGQCELKVSGCKNNGKQISKPSNCPKEEPQEDKSFTSGRGEPSMKKL